MKKNALSIGLSALALFLAGCGTLQGQDQALDTGDTTDGIVQMNAEQGGFVFFRDADDAFPKAVVISIDGEYLTSLLPGEYSPVAVCANRVQPITVAYTGQDAGYLMKAERQGPQAQPKQGEIFYIQIVHQPEGLPLLMEVPADVAKEELAQTTLHTYTRPRVNNQNNCGPVKEEVHVLNSDVLFPFDQSSVDSILPPGREDTIALAQSIDNQRLDSVAVHGHTDPTGTDAYNQTLSEKRAASIRELMIAGGVNASIIEVQGFGESKLIVDDCFAQFPGDREAQRACNEVNRRVEVIVRTR
ncbi:OmpA family protein [Suttonella sp. R2A3]|uniref:OmpA family protein n=1 Tax=Suttonella sp. R2A3 TaxID=2908648 RepID=UPI001F1674E5|nr:OmpA family protein [Suttonella sp. R2A3]UJF25353.1 OmpA family protein [Suttonella sp. R2A3]